MPPSVFVDCPSSACAWVANPRAAHRQQMTDKTQECICTLLSDHSQRNFWWKSFSCGIFRCLSSEMKLLLMFRALSFSTVSRESERHQQKPACPWFKRSFNEFRKLNNRAIEEILTFKGWTDGTVNKWCIHVIYLKLLVNVMKKLRTSKWGRVCWVFVISNIIVGWVIFRSSGKLLNPSKFWSSAHVLVAEQWTCLYIAGSWSPSHNVGQVCPGLRVTRARLHMWLLTPAPGDEAGSGSVTRLAITGHRSRGRGRSLTTENWGRSQCQTCPPPPSHCTAQQRLSSGCLGSCTSWFL